MRKQKDLYQIQIEVPVKSYSGIFYFDIVSFGRLEQMDTSHISYILFVCVKDLCFLARQ